jgi:hypothetical protein
MQSKKIIPKLIKKRNKEPLKKTFHLFDDLDLKPRQKLFVAYYCANHFNAYEAYIKAGYNTTTEGSAQASASILLRNPKIVEAMSRYIKDILAPCKSELEKRIYDVWFKRAFYDVKMFINDDGSPAFAGWDEIPEEWRVVVDGIETKAYGKDASVEKIVIKLANKENALDKLDKYIGMTRETNVLELVEIPAGRKKEIAGMFEGKLE